MLVIKKWKVIQFFSIMKNEYVDAKLEVTLLSVISWSKIEIYITDDIAYLNYKIKKAIQTFLVSNVQHNINFWFKNKFKNY